MRLPGLLKRLISFLLLCPLVSTAQQDITGLWKGTLYNDTTRETLRFEVGISQEKGKLTGFSHTFIQHEDKLYFAIKKIKVKEKNGKIVIEDLDVIANSSPLTPPKGVYKTCVLALQIKDSLMELSGPFITNRTKEYHPLTGLVYLQRKNDYYQSDLLSRLSELRLANETNFALMAYVSPKAQPGDIASKTTPAAKVPVGSIAAAPPVPEKEAVTLPKIDMVATKVQLREASPAIGTIAGNKGVAVDSFALPVVATELPLGKSNAAANTLTTTPTAQGSIAGGKLANVTVNKLPVITAPAFEVNNRILETIENVMVESDSLQLTLYDNGEVDGDTVSVLLNGQLIMPKQGLSTKAIKKTIYMPAGTDSVQLVMYAENLGSIPPNTGLLVVHDGDRVYEIRFSADMKKNAAIVFRRKRQ